MMRAVIDGLRLAVAVLVGASMWGGLVLGGWILRLVGFGRQR
jgi:hypothetical protein